MSINSVSKASGLDALDRLAAEKVMGWEPGKQDKYQRFPDYYCWFSKGVYAGYLVFYPEDYDGFQIVWQPSRNIAQAWECLEKLTPEEAFDIHIVKSWLGWRCNILSQEEYEVDFAPGGHGKAVFEYRESVPLSIVLACLKARGVTLPGGVE